MTDDGEPMTDDGGYAEFAAALEDGEPFVFCLTCRHIALEDHNCLAWPSADEEVTADGV